MNLKSFISTNSFLLGTIIIIGGFVWMFSIVIANRFFEQTMYAFCFTISGLIFWWISNHLSEPKTEKRIESSASNRQTETVPPEKTV